VEIVSLFSIISLLATIDGDQFYIHYKDGFGEPEANHWLGLDKIHYITTSRPHHLFVQVFNNIDWKERWRKYENFKVEDESTNYRMTYSGSFPWTQSEASADPYWTKAILSTPLGDSMIGLNGSAFSTFDRDNDLDAGRNCAQEYQGGWWYNACADCNPNGPLKNPRNPSALDEAFWKYDFMNNYTPHIEMTIRTA
ncbi:angiopoietin-related protein 6-like, partial [Patella vulgata]|uniref:angiopoietin-related protein 6-like n=1 Tax=Patella vulgata TaxID=6465 RepID=UPI0024A97AD0